MANPMSQRWNATIFEEHVGLGYEPDIPDGAAYSVWGKERCPTTGRIHFHVYVRFATRKRFSTVKTLFPDGTHLEICKGSEESNRDYCWCVGEHADKRPHLIEQGPEKGEFDATRGKQGHRSDLEAIGEEVIKGTSLANIARAHVSDFIRYHGGIVQLATLVAPPPQLERPVQTIVLWGPTGTGKTHRIMHSYPTAYSVMPGRDPWGQYSDQTVILFDEFDWERWPITDMNRYLDKWRCSLDARYNNRSAAWELVVILANSPPNTWYQNAAPLLYGAFLRRVRGRTWTVNDREQSLQEILDSPPQVF